MSDKRQLMPAFRWWCLAAISALALVACGLGMDAKSRIERGQQAFASGDYEAAIIDARNVLIEEPGNIDARILLARSLIETADGATAEKEIRRAIDLGAAPDQTLENLGRALLLQGKFRDVVNEVSPEAVSSAEARLAVLRVRAHGLVGIRQTEEARELYSEVLATLNDDVDSKLGIVSSYVVDRNFVQARATMNEVLATHDDSLQAWLNSGSLSLRTRDLDRAAVDFQRALDLLEGQSDRFREMRALAGYAEAAILGGRADEVRPALARMQALAPRDARTLLNTARLAALDGDWITAQVNLQEILRFEPEYRPAQLLLGVAHKQSGNLGQAEMYLSAVVAAAPDNANARRLLAETRLELKKSAAARQAIDSIVTNPNADARSLSIAAAASLDLGDFEDAADLQRRSLSANPGNVDLQIELALTLLRSGDLDGAVELLEGVSDDAGEQDAFRRDFLLVMTALKSGPEIPVADAEALLQRWPEQSAAWSLAGSFDMAAEDYVAARQKFQRSIELAPGDSRPVRYLAQLDEAEGDLVSAESRYLQVVDRDPGDATAMLALARLAALAEKPDESIDWLEKARLAEPRSIAPVRQLAFRYLAARNFAAAEAVAREGIALDADSAELHAVIGQARLADRDLEGALAEFRNALRANPDEPAFALYVATTEEKLGNPQAAMAVLQEGMPGTLQHIPSGVLLVWLHIKAGNLDAAERVAEELQRIHPDEASPHAVRAEVLLRRGDLVAASAAFDKAISLRIDSRYAMRASQIRQQANLAEPLQPITAYLNERPFDTTVRLLLAQILQRAGDADSANQQYARVLEYEPDNLIAGNNLAWGYLRSDDERAEPVARRAYNANPNNSAIADTLGWILVSKGRVGDGLELLRDAVRLNADSGEIRYHLAAALARAGEREEARAMLAALLATETSFASRADAERLLATLQAGLAN